MTSVALSGDGLKAVSRSEDMTVRVWDVSSGVCIKTVEGHTGDVTSVALSGDGLKAVSGSEDRTVRVWDITSG